MSKRKVHLPSFTTKDANGRVDCKGIRRLVLLTSHNLDSVTCHNCRTKLRARNPSPDSQAFLNQLWGAK